jgi:hypothetical protein
MLDGINLGNEQWATLIGWPEADGIGDMGMM